MAKVLLRDVKAAERAWARASTASMNPAVDLAVSRALGKYQDLKAQYEAQKVRSTWKSN